MMIALSFIFSRNSYKTNPPNTYYSLRHIDDHNVFQYRSSRFNIKLKHCIICFHKVYSFQNINKIINKCCIDSRVSLQIRFGTVL